MLMPGKVGSQPDLTSFGGGFATAPSFWRVWFLAHKTKESNQSTKRGNNTKQPKRVTETRHLGIKNPLGSKFKQVKKNR